MPNNIFQISTSPVKQEDYLAEGDFFEHWFIGCVADYVLNAYNRSEEIQNFRHFLVSHKAARFYEKNSIIRFTILPGGKEAYFAEKYKAFAAARDRTKEMGLQEFSSGLKFAQQMQKMRSFLLGYGRLRMAG